MNFLVEGFRKHLVVHLGWIIAILLGITILLASAKLGTSQDVKDIINTALALTSVFLASFAIVQAFFSSSALDNVISSMRTEVENIKGPASEIKSAADTLTNQSHQLATGQETIKNQIELLKENRAEQKENAQKIISDGDNSIINNVTNGFAGTAYICKRSFELKRFFNIDNTTEFKWIQGYRTASFSVIKGLGIIEVIERDAEKIVIKILKPDILDNLIDKMSDKYKKETVEEIEGFWKKNDFDKDYADEIDDDIPF